MGERWPLIIGLNIALNDWKGQGNLFYIGKPQIELNPPLCCVFFTT